MLQIRPFCNTDPIVAAWLWNEKATLYPEIYCPVTADILSAHIFGNVLFDRNGFFIATDNDQPVGFVHAYFPPSQNWDDKDLTKGIIFPPIIHPSLNDSDKKTLAHNLIITAENYLTQKGSTLWYAGGCSFLPPFYSGLYGRDISYGLLEEKDNLINSFVELGYQFDQKFRRFQLWTNKYTAPFSMKIREARRTYKVLKNLPSVARSWWDANVFRNFRTFEWNVFPIREDSQDSIVAGAVLQQLETFSLTPFTIISDFGVDENLSRRGIGSVLLSEMILELQQTFYRPMLVSMTAPAGDERMAAFLTRHHFNEVSSLFNLIKNKNEASVTPKE